MSIQEIAKRAGVSIAAVSYALNNKKNISKEKRELILKIAEEMNYVPNSLAKGLLSRRTNIIGLVVPDVSMPYTLEIIRHLEYYARINDLYLLLGHTDGQTSTLQSIVDNFINKNVDALILATGLRTSGNEGDVQDAVSRLNKFKVPSVVVSPYDASTGLKTNYVIPDLEEGSYEITRYLLQKGLRKLIYMGGFPSDYVTAIRRNGFLRALDESSDANPEDAVFLDGGYTFQEGYKVIRQLFDEGAPLPDALVAVNDSVALGIYKGLRERGIRVPEDVSLVGYDDIQFPTMDFIPLTTVKIPVEEMSKLCIEGLLKQWEGQKMTFQFALKPELVIRNSVQNKNK